MADHYTKLWSQIVESTLWRDDNDLIVLWIVILAKKDKDHVVRTPIPTLARFANMSVAECEKKLKILASPDPYSQSPDHEGRRILKLKTGGYFVVNGQKYQDHLKHEQRKAAVAAAVAKCRQKQKSRKGGPHVHGPGESQA